MAAPSTEHQAVNGLSKKLEQVRLYLSVLDPSLTVKSFAATNLFTEWQRKPVSEWFRLEHQQSY